MRGEALGIAEAMGVMGELRARATKVTTLAFINASGRKAVTMRLSDAGPGGPDDIEVARRDLSAVLGDAARQHAEFRFDEAIDTLTQDADGVDVVFASGARGRFDLVIGADGTHSSTRRMVFGDESAFVEYLGLFVATVPLPGDAVDVHAVVNYNEPGRMLSVHPANGKPIAAFVFRHPAVPDFDHRDVAQHRRIVTDAYAGGGWRTAELLDVVRSSPDLYFDAVSRVRIASWSKGRVALVGDAASSVSLFGEGSSMAMVGAKTLADALSATPGDHATAFARYEREHRVRVDPLGKNVAAVAGFLIPKTHAGIAVRDLAVRVIGFWSGVRARLTPAVQSAN
jgi:2-polyprenyl-6-methoxyphenol hydroxylase-like FAD-dependent oxidoreductase